MELVRWVTGNANLEGPTKVVYSDIESDVSRRSMVDALFHWGESQGRACEAAEAAR